MVASSSDQDPREGGESLQEQVARYQVGLELLEGIQSNYSHLVERLMTDLETEKAKSEALLRNILPEPIIERLRAGAEVIADRYDDVAIVFCDLVDFTGTAAVLGPADLVASLNEIFSRFDSLADEFGVEKIKTIGDAYLAASGLPVPRAGHLEAAAAMALRMRRAVTDANEHLGHGWQIRIGLNAGPVVAGIIGTHKYAYDVWGDTVNMASRLQTSAEPGDIQVTKAVAERLAPEFVCRARGSVSLKGTGPTEVYQLVDRMDVTAAV
jgi:adenylate cyclase